MKKVYVVGEAKHYANFIKDFELINDMSEADIVVFTGGEDVDPSLYNEKPHFTTYSNIERDLYEKEVFDSIRQDQLVVGICRGSQFLCVMNGGKLVQDCNNHAIYETHPIVDCRTNTVYEITSTHHQMQYPYTIPKDQYTIVATCYGLRSNYSDGGGIIYDVIAINGEPEIVEYHRSDKPRCLAIQGHPEYMRKESPVVNYINELIDNNLKLVK